MESIGAENILVVDDEDYIRNVIVEFLTREGYQVQGACSAEDALELLKMTVFDVLITDMKLPHRDGNSLLQEALTIYPEIIGIVMSGYSTIENAVKAMRNGAYDYISKPFQLVEASLVIKKALKHRRLKEENCYLKAQLNEKHGFGNIIGKSKSMQEVFQVVETIAGTSSTILITGETGTGKELIAKAVHYRSLRKNQKIVCINCGAIPENLLESELFGHLKGAFTGADQTRIGRFEQANKGTIFLDEIGNMSQALQVKLLRVLQEREFERIGGSESIKIDVRIIAATSANLKDMVERNEFRSDLYYRLNVIPIHLPALRERREDIPLLVRHFVEKHRQLLGHDSKTVSQEAMKMLMNFNWPGNIRQLENAIERAVALMGMRAMILPMDLPQEIQNTNNNLFLSEVFIPDDGVNFNTQVSSLERELILQSLRRTNGNRGEAAKLLSLKRTTLVEKLKRLNIQEYA